MSDASRPKGRRAWFVAKRYSGYVAETPRLQDQPQIERIRERLWNGREFGRAAVMVGAGFSRSAERRSANDSPLPLWSEFASAMQDRLYPPAHPGAPARRDAEMGAMRLATEYETVFGRPALDDLIARLIPDASYGPGRLHRNLLSLPWSDVFTTNYDTLLERAQEAVHDRKYDVVLTVQDIPAQTKPRIVKLHGSFSSHRPFIATEEDYRTYPTKFASFVNMVQQSVMENAFCLLGFSGDDPNFLSWTGWVRDNLGPAAPPIYLCGVLDLTNAQRRLLENRNVIPVDLAPLFPTDRWFDLDERYAAGIEWFLESLREGEQPTAIGWPTPRKIPRDDRSERLPPVPPGPQPVSDPGPAAPANRVLSAEAIDLDEVRKLSETWSRQRLEYPGWIVAPAANRETLWGGTKGWIDHVLLSVEVLPPQEGLFLLRELNWRLERSLVPLFLEWAEKVEQVLNVFNPYPDLIDVGSATVKPTEAQHAGLDWGRIEDCWVELAFALARVAREDQENDRFRLWMNRTRDVARRRDEWHARWFYEECLFHLSRFDQEKARTTLKRWPESVRLPFWQIKRASIVAELGDTGEADEIASRALAEIRSRQRPYLPELDLLSQEGWAVFFLEAVKQDRVFEAATRGLLETEEIQAQESRSAGYRGRREELERHRCNPETEIERLEARLAGPPPHLRPRPDGVTRGFDPGRESVTFSLFFGSSEAQSIDPVRPAFAFLKMLEDGGMPYWCGATSTFPDAAKKASEWVEPNSRPLSRASMLRGASTEDARRWFDRVYVATMPEDGLNRLFDTFLESLTQSIRRLVDSPQEIGLRTTFSQRQVEMMAELLSHLSIRGSADQLATLFDLATTMYELPLFQRYHLLHDCPRWLFDRLLSSSMSRPEILSRIPKLLALPIPGEGGFRVSVIDSWVEPFDYVDRDAPSAKLEDGFDRSSWSAPIANLLSIVRSGEPEARKRASMRLARLHGIGGLNDEESKDFGEALWSRVDNAGLPRDTPFFRDGFLRLPEPTAGRAERSFRESMLSENFRRVVVRFSGPNGEERTSVSGSPSRDWYAERLLSGTIPPLAESEEQRRRFVDWSRDETIAFLHKMVDYWDDEKGVVRPMLLQKGDPLVDHGLAWRYREWVDVMSVIVLPRIADADEPTRKTAKRFLAELKEAGVVVLAASPMLLFFEPGLQEEIVSKMHKGLAATGEERVEGATEGLYRWLAHGVRGRVTSPPDDLLNELISRAIGRRQPRLDLVLARLVEIVKDMPQVLSDGQIDALCLSLENLLEETKLPEHENRAAAGQSTAPIPVDHRPCHRAMAARLAFGLHVELTRKGAQIPQVLDDWRRAVRTDPLPEVRRAWRN